MSIWEAILEDYPRTKYNQYLWVVEMQLRKQPCASGKKLLRAFAQHQSQSNEPSYVLALRV